VSHCFAVRSASSHSVRFHPFLIGRVELSPNLRVRLYRPAPSCISELGSKMVADCSRGGRKRQPGLIRTGFWNNWVNRAFVARQRSVPGREDGPTRDVPPNDTRRALPTAGPSGMAEPKLRANFVAKILCHLHRNWTPVFPGTIYLLLWLSISRAAPKVPAGSGVVSNASVTLNRAAGS
jgi:hypothetical protein